MQDNNLFEYAVIRVVPKVEREEFLNVGVVLYCPKQKFLDALFTLNETKLRAFAPGLDMEEIAEHLRSFKQIAGGSPDGGPIARLDPPSRFRWLTATRSTILQASKVHPGFCAHPQQALARLHQQLVL